MTKKGLIFFILALIGFISLALSPIIGVEYAINGFLLFEVITLLLVGFRWVYLIFTLLISAALIANGFLVGVVPLIVNTAFSILLLCTLIPVVFKKM